MSYHDSHTFNYDREGMKVPKDVIHAVVSAKKLPKRAFKYCSSLKTVKILDGVRHIGEEAFESCKALTTVTFPSSGLTTIGEDAFYSCYSLTHAKLPEGLRRLGVAAFHSCKSLTTVEIPDSVERIGGDAFRGCESLTKVIIPPSVQRIAGSTFFGCKRLEAVVLPECLESIEGSAFFSCHSLMVVEVPDSVGDMRNGVFYDCTKLKSAIGNRADVHDFVRNRFYDLPAHRVIYRRYSAVSKEKVIQNLHRLYDVYPNAFHATDAFGMTPMDILKLTASAERKEFDNDIINWLNGDRHATKYESDEENSRPVPANRREHEEERREVQERPEPRKRKPIEKKKKESFVVDSPETWNRYEKDTQEWRRKEDRFADNDVPSLDGSSDNSEESVGADRFSFERPTQTNKEVSVGMKPEMPRFRIAENSMEQNLNDMRERFAHKLNNPKKPETSMEEDEIHVDSGVTYDVAPGGNELWTDSYDSSISPCAASMPALNSPPPTDATPSRSALKPSNYTPPPVSYEDDASEDAYDEGSAYGEEDIDDTPPNRSYVHSLPFFTAKPEVKYDYERQSHVSVTPRYNPTEKKEAGIPGTQLIDFQKAVKSAHEVVAENQARIASKQAKEREEEREAKERSRSLAIKQAKARKEKEQKKAKKVGLGLFGNSNKPKKPTNIKPSAKATTPRSKSAPRRARSSSRPRSAPRGVRSSSRPRSAPRGVRSSRSRSKTRSSAPPSKRATSLQRMPNESSKRRSGRSSGSRSSGSRRSRS